MINWQELINLIFCRRSNEELAQALDRLSACHDQRDELRAELEKAIEINRQLELLITRPTPPEIDFIIEKDTTWVQAVIEDLEASIIRLPLGVECRLTSKSNFLEIVAWDWIDSIPYHKFYRCGNFAISFKAHVDQYFNLNQVGIVLDYKSKHAYNVVIFPDGKAMLLEPQSDNLFWWEDDEVVFYNLKGAYVII